MSESFRQYVRGQRYKSGHRPKEGEKRVDAQGHIWVRTLVRDPLDANPTFETFEWRLLK